MEHAVYIYWLIFGGILVFSEFILPGLVAVFVGLGAVTTAGLLYVGYIDNIAQQFITFFASSIVYIFSLRLLVVRFYPSDTSVHNIDEDSATFGTIAVVVEEIPAKGTGRVSHGGTTWQATASTAVLLKVGQSVKILDRDNITWIVQQSNEGDR